MIEVDPYLRIHSKYTSRDLYVPRSVVSIESDQKLSAAACAKREAVNGAWRHAASRGRTYTQTQEAA